MEFPEFKPSPLEIWSSVFLTFIMVIVSTYSSWAAQSLGSATTFHLTHGISTSWLGICGVGISIMATLLEWRGFGLNAVAVFLGSVALTSSLVNSFSFGLTAATFISITWLVVAIHFSRRFYEDNPFKTFMALWSLTFVSSLSQSILYKIMFAHSYPLQGVLVLKVILFGLGGLAMFLAFPRKNTEYVL